MRKINSSLNQEGFSGYKPPLTNKIWSSMIKARTQYMQQTFLPSPSFYSNAQLSRMNGLALQSRTYSFEALLHQNFKNLWNLSYKKFKVLMGQELFVLVTYIYG